MEHRNRRAELPQGGDQRPDLLPLALPLRRDDARRGQGEQAPARGEQALKEGGGRFNARQPDPEEGGLGKLVGLERRRKRVNHVRAIFKVSERRACRVLGQPRRTQRYIPKPDPVSDNLTAEIRMLALCHPRYGYKRITALLKRSGWKLNRKRVLRIWRREGLKVRSERSRSRRPGRHRRAELPQGGDQRPDLLPLALPLRRDDDRRGQGSQAPARGEHALKEGGGRSNARQPDPSMRGLKETSKPGAAAQAR